MTDSSYSDIGQPEDGELLAAYLDDDLDEVTARALERRLEADAALRDNLDAIHNVMLRMRRVDEVDVPDDVQERIRARVAQRSSAEAPGSMSARGRRRASVPGHAPTPWWRRPIAAAAAIGLLGILAISSLGIISVGGLEGDDSGGRQEAAVTAQADEAGEEAGGADSPAIAEERAAESDTGVAALSTEAAAIAPESVIEVPGLDTQEGRLAFLEELTRPSDQDLLSARPGARTGEQRAALREWGLPPTCVERLLPEGSPSALQLVVTDGSQGQWFGAAVRTEGGALMLRLVDPSDACAIVVEEVVDPEGSEAP